MEATGSLAAIPAAGPPQRTGRARLVVGYLAIAAILPYFTLKLFWIAGSTVGISTVSPLGAAVVRGGNTVTAAMEVVAIVIILAFTHSWGLRAPAWLVLAPTWVGIGLLAPFIFTGSVVAVASLTGSSAVGDGSLAPWVGPLVYGSFGAQAIGITASFTLYARDRWPRVFRSRIADHPTGPYQSVLILFVWLITGMLAVVVLARSSWALGSTSGLSPRLIGARGVAEALADAGTALFAIAAAVGLLALVYRRPPQRATWVPVTLAWVGGGAVFGNGLYPTMLLVAGAGGSGAGGSQGALVPFVDLLQALTGAVIFVVGAFLLVELDTFTNKDAGTVAL